MAFRELFLVLKKIFLFLFFSALSLRPFGVAGQASRHCVIFFSFWDFNFHFFPKSLCSNAFIEHGRKLLVSYQPE